MIGPPEKTWMINFRVDDLDAMVDPTFADAALKTLGPYR